MFKCQPTNPFDPVLLGMRVWAVWNRNLHIGIGLVVAGLILFSAAGAGMYYYSKSLKCGFFLEC